MTDLPTRRPEFRQDWGETTLALVREHMERLHDYADQVNQGYEDVLSPPTMTDAPFCGCDVCDERERYTLLMALTLEGQATGKVKLSAPTDLSGESATPTDSHGGNNATHPE